jgi:hypothetical protein
MWCCSSFPEHEIPWYYVRKVLYTCKRLMIEAMEPRTLEEFSKFLKKKKENKKEKKQK